MNSEPSYVGVSNSEASGLSRELMWHRNVTSSQFRALEQRKV